MSKIHTKLRCSFRVHGHNAAIFGHKKF